MPPLHHATDALPRAITAPTARARTAPVARVWAAARLALAGIFLWAFADKLLGLGYATAPARAWLAGGSPTRGFLTHTSGSLAPIFQAIAGHPVVDALFMAALLGVGIALLLGIGMRIAAASGATLMLLMWAAGTLGVAGTTNPLLDDHIVYALVLLGLALADAGSVAGLGRAWARLPLVQRFPALR